MNNIATFTHKSCCWNPYPIWKVHFLWFLVKKRNSPFSLQLSETQPLSSQIQSTLEVDEAFSHILSEVKEGVVIKETQIGDNLMVLIMSAPTVAEQITILIIVSSNMVIPQVSSNAQRLFLGSLYLYRNIIY